MSGIIGYVGREPSLKMLLEGLNRLAYGGYDSAGLAWQDGDTSHRVRTVGKLPELSQAIADAGLDAGAAKPAPDGGFAGIAHLRWATHGRVTEENAHPQADETGEIQIVLNGIVENHAELRTELEAEGYRLSSETDAEVVAHLVRRYWTGELAVALREAADRLRGQYSIVAMHSGQPGVLVGTRYEAPLLVGIGKDGNFFTSAIPAVMAETRNILAVENGEMATLKADSVRLEDADGAAVKRDPETVTWDDETAEKGGFDTFTMKEIHEQPGAITETLLDRLKPDDSGIDLSEMDLSDGFLGALSRVVIVACGTSYHAGMVGRYAIERWARIPVEIEVASEYRYRDPVVGPGDLVIGITQSGETADTLAALTLAREKGATVLGVTNVMGSQVTRQSDGVLYTRAGIEIGIAATKTYVSQVVVMYLLALRLAEIRRCLEPSELTRLVRELREIPKQMESIIDPVSERMKTIAERHYTKGFFLYIGRHIGLPVAMEGALKLKEVSYIPSEAYAAGEMKHGPIALLEKGTPVLCVATDSPVLDKMLSNIEEVRVREADAIAIATEGDVRPAAVADETIFVPATDWLLQPLLAVLPLQLLAYHVAELNGLDVDRPRNLAKAVTVE